MRYATLRSHVATFHIDICIAERNEKIFSCLRPGDVQKNLTRAVRRKQTYIFLAYYLESPT